MKNKEIKQLIKKQADNVQINDYSDNILKEYANSHSSFKTNDNYKKKKNIFPVLLTVCASLVGICIILTNVIKNNDIKNNDNSLTFTFENMYNYSAISGINMLNNVQKTTSLKKKQLTDNEKQDIITNLKMVENMLDGNLAKSEEEASDKEEYEKKYSITTTSLNNQQKEYLFYYNEKILDNDDDDDDDEVNIELSGIVIMDNVTYVMNGKKEVEDDESEMEFKISLDEENYVIIEQEFENDETEFGYSQYHNGKKIYETSIEYELDKNGKIEFEFEEKTQESKTKLKYEFITKKDGNKYIIIKEKNHEVTTIRVEVSEDGYINYIFE